MTKKKQEITTENVTSYLDKDQDKKPPIWQTRQRTCLATLVFCGICILYILFAGKELQVYETIAMGCFALAGSTIGILVGAQTWHNINEDKINAVTKVRTAEAAPKKIIPVTATATEDSDEK